MTRPITAASVLAPAALLALAAGLIAGPLTPPSGPVASAYKTLTEVEPRIPLGQATTPASGTYLFTINQPGSYYLTGNVATGPSQNGVLVNAPDVTLDLNGFTIRGNGGEIGVSVAEGENAPTNIAVRNGSIVGFNQRGISGNASIDIRDVHVTGASGASYGIVIGADCRVRSCTVTNANVGVAVSFGSSIEDCTLSLNGTGARVTGGLIRGCSISNNVDAGLAMSSGAVATDNVLFNNSPTGTGLAAGISITGNGCRVERNTVTGSWAGIRLDAAATDTFVAANRVRTGSGLAYVMSGQGAGSFPNNHVAQIVANPASPFTTTNPLANIEH